MHMDLYGAGSGGFGDSDEDVIEIEILPGGIIKITTDPISGANHANAENLIDNINRMAGGATEVERRSDHHHHHQHEHGHDHLHH